jgi:hypothetical protein
MIYSNLVSCGKFCRISREKFLQLQLLRYIFFEENNNNEVKCRKIEVKKKKLNDSKKNKILFAIALKYIVFCHINKPK